MMGSESRNLPRTNRPQEEVGARSCTVDQQEPCALQIFHHRDAAQQNAMGGLTTWRADPLRNQGGQQGIPRSSVLASCLGCPYCISTRLRWGPTCVHRLRGLPNQNPPLFQIFVLPWWICIRACRHNSSSKMECTSATRPGCTTRGDRLKTKKRSPSSNREITASRAEC